LRFGRIGNGGRVYIEKTKVEEGRAGSQGKARGRIGIGVCRRVRW
jgi:hypothetical protein